MNKFALFIIGLGIGGIIVATTFPLWRPFFVDDVVDEAFPFPQMTEEERTAFEQLPIDQQEELIRMADMALETSLSMTKIRYGNGRRYAGKHTNSFIRRLIHRN